METSPNLLNLSPARWPSIGPKPTLRVNAVEPCSFIWASSNHEFRGVRGASAHCQISRYAPVRSIAALILSTEGADSISAANSSAFRMMLHFQSRFGIAPG